MISLNEVIQVFRSKFISDYALCFKQQKEVKPQSSTLYFYLFRLRETMELTLTWHTQVCKSGIRNEPQDLPGPPKTIIDLEHDVCTQSSKQKLLHNFYQNIFLCQCYGTSLLDFSKITESILIFLSTINDMYQANSH